MTTVVQQLWEESERGWGIRPDGFSLHLTNEQLKQYVEEYWKRQPDGPAPAEYSRPSGHPKLIEVSDEIFEKITETEYGLRTFARSIAELEIPPPATIEEATEAIEEIQDEAVTKIDAYLRPLIEAEFRKVQKHHPDLKRLLFGNGTSAFDFDGKKPRDQPDWAYWNGDVENVPEYAKRLCSLIDLCLEHIHGLGENIE